MKSERAGNTAIADWLDILGPRIAVIVLIERGDRYTFKYLSCSLFVVLVAASSVACNSYDSCGGDGWLVSFVRPTFTMEKCGFGGNIGA